MIETKTPAVQLDALGKTRIALTYLERFAQREDAITAAQAAPIDAAVNALYAALALAGAGAPIDPLAATVQNGGTAPVKTSAGAAVPGTAKYSVANSAVVDIKLAATVATVTSGLSSVAATGTGTKVTFTVAAGAITAITLSA